MATGPEPTPGKSVEPPLSRKERILVMLGDPTSRYLLGALDREPHSVQELLEANHIPQSTLYRRLHELRELGMVGIQTSLRSQDAKRLDMFRSLVEEVRVTVRGDLFDLQIQYRNLGAERLQSIWGKLRQDARR